MFFKRLFPVGTRSLLFGVHQIFWHPLTVYLAWWKLYGRPSWKESVCIFIHDWGYWGKVDIDGEHGQNHPELGARIAGYLFGKEYHDLVLYHSRTYAKKNGVKPSLLCWPDKLSISVDPKSFYLFRARISGELKEYMEKARKYHGMHMTDDEWYDWLRYHLREAAYQEAGDKKARGSES